MKLFFVIIFLFISATTTFSATEKSFIHPELVQEYMKYIDEPEDVQNAREILFYTEINIPYEINTSEYQKFFIDKSYNYKTNSTSKLKWITYYSNGMYEWHKNSIWLSFIYQRGNLIYIEKIFYDKKIHNYISYMYDIYGKLKYITYIDAPNEYKLQTKEYIFDINKKYIGKFINEKFYDEKSKNTMTSRDFLPY